MSYRLVYNDAAHSYYLNGKRCKSVTAVAKTMTDSFAIDEWRKRQIAIGMMLEPRLAERVAVDPDNRETVNAVCEDAMKIAGAHHAADRGTQRHRASELIDVGGKLWTEQQREDAAAWQRTIEKYDIEIDPTHVEGFSLWPDHKVTGRFDRIARYRGRHVMIDLKSGENAVKYPHGTAVQLALYARAPLISVGGKTAGDKTTVAEWAPPPADLDVTTGYVVLLNSEMEVGELWEIDITHGWAGAQLALSGVQWRKAHNRGAELARPIEPVTQEQAIALLERELGAEVVPLAEQVAAAPSAAALEQLWAANRSEWTDELTAMARLRKQSLSPKNLTAHAARK